MFDRWYAGPLAEKLRRPFVQVMFGARQTGKSTLLNALLPEDTLRIDLSESVGAPGRWSFPRD